MREHRGVALAVNDGVDQLVERVLQAAAEAPRRERIRRGLETAIDAAESDPEAARQALWTLRSDRLALERLERCLGHDPNRATLALGAAIQLAHDQLSPEAPDLRSSLSELLRWLESDW
jgi:hypothetical protein